MDEKVIELPPVRRLGEERDVRDSDAEYTLEYSASCPACLAAISTVKVVRILRTRVNFTSTLPRHGQLLICPECRAVLGAGLALL